MLLDPRTAKQTIVGILILVAVASIVTFAPTPSCVAGTGQVHQSPQPRRPGSDIPVSNLRLTIDTNWVWTPGYRPYSIRIETRSGKVVASDRTFTVKLRKSDAASTQSHVATGSLTMAKNMSFGETTIYMLQPGESSEQFGYSFRVYENGVEHADLAIQITDRFNFNNRQELIGIQAAPVALFVASGATGRSNALRTGLAPMTPLWPMSQTKISTGEEFEQRSDLEQMLLMLKFYDPRQPVAPSASILGPSMQNAFYDNGRAHLTNLAEMPDTWLGLSCFDLVCIHYGDLIQLRQSSPDKFDALVNWLATGASLVVLDVEDKLKLDALFEINSDGVNSNWLQPDPAMMIPFDPHARWGGDGTTLKVRAAPGLPLTQWKEEADFQTKKLSLGTIYAVAKVPKTDSLLLWNTIFNSILRDKMRWRERVGFLVGEADSRFHQFLIPGVGLPPVTTFRALIFLFVVFIGPISCFVLMRQKRLFLLFATVPISAVVICISLVIYALVADGLGTQLRCTSYSEIDQQLGHLTTWARHSYYSGSMPTDGYSFPAETTVYHIYGERDVSQQHQIDWVDQQQVISGKSISSRRTLQFLTTNSWKSDAGLIVVEVGDEGTPTIQVTNQLRGHIISMAIVDSRGQSYIIENLKMGETGVPKTIAANEVTAAVRTLIMDGKPAYPQGFSSSSMRLSRNRPIVAMTNKVRYSYDADGTIDRKMDEIIAGSGTIFLDNKSYVAVLEQFEELPKASRFAKQKEGLHVVRGKW